MHPDRVRNRVARTLLLLGALSWVAACGALNGQSPTDLAPTAIGSAVSPAAPTHTPPRATTSAPTETAQPSSPASELPAAATQPTVSMPTGTATARPTLPPLAHIAAGLPLTITSIHMIDSSTGWAVARDDVAVNHILRSTDGGVDWRDVSPPDTGYASPPWTNSPATALSDFLDANRAWVIFWADTSQLTPVWHTSDGGQTWEGAWRTPFVANEAGGPTTLTFVDAQTGWLFVAIQACGTGGCDDHGLYATTDGGHTWQAVGRTYQGGLSDCIKTGVTFVGAQTGWVSGYCSMALVYLLQRTDDGGHTWRSQTLPPPPGEPNLLDFSQSAGCQANGPVFTSALAGILDMVCPNPKDYPVKRWLYFTTDGGQTWWRREAPTPLGAADFVDSNTGWWLTSTEPDSPGLTRLYQTTDAGRTWTLIKQLAWSGSLDFISPQIGWAVARAGDSIALVKTEDGGRTWQQLMPQSR